MKNCLPEFAAACVDKVTGGISRHPAYIRAASVGFPMKAHSVCRCTGSCLINRCSMNHSRGFVKVHCQREESSAAGPSNTREKGGILITYSSMSARCFRYELDIFRLDNKSTIRCSPQAVPRNCRKTRVSFHSFLHPLVFYPL